MNKTSILIVEDEAIVAADLAAKVRQLGYDVAGPAATGEEAVELARTQQPALVLMDIRLAGAMDGIAAAEQIHRECHLPVLFLTAHSDTGTVERARQAEAFGYILKPFDERDLRIQIEMALYKHASEQKNRQSASELQSVNAKLHESRRAALNMMEDADSARRRAEEVSAEMLSEMIERKRAEGALRESEKRFRDIASASADWIWEIDIEGKYTFASESIKDVLGYEAGEIIGLSPFDLMPPVEAARVRHEIQAILDRSEPFRDFENDNLHKNGGIRHVVTSGVPIFNALGLLCCYRGVDKDITERKRNEERLAAQARVLKALNSSSKTLLHATDELALLQSVCSIVVEDCGHAMVWIGFAEHDAEKSVRPVASAGFEEGYLETLNITWADTEQGRGPAGTAIRTGKPCGCGDMHSDPAFEPWREEALRRGYASSLVLPLMDGGKAIGVLNIYSAQPFAFAEEEAALLMQLADELAYGIRTVRLRVAHDQAEEMLMAYYRRQNLLADTASRLLAADSPQQVVDALCRQVMEFLDCQAFFNFLVDEQEGRLHLNACSGISEEEKQRIEWLDYGTAVCGCAARDACRIVAEEIPGTTDPRTELVKSYGIQAYACHPLMVEGRVLGTLSFGARTRSRFSGDDLALMSAVADQVAIAVERMQSARALKLSHDELEKRVAERTSDLAMSLELLRDEIKEREQAEKSLHAETLERLRAVEALREQERMLIQQSRLAAMGEMINNIAHQWRQPLNTLGLFTQSLALFYETPRFNKEFLDASVKKSMELISHMSRTIDDFRNFFKPDKEKVEFRVHEVAARTVALVQDSFNNVQIGIDVHANSDPSIFGFPNEYSQVLLNILMNARDALSEKHPENPRVDVTIDWDGGKSLVTVVDNAGGIPEENMTKIFEPYFTTKGPAQGTGVGLFMSKTIIEKNMNGRLTVRNTGDGAEFRIEV